MDIEKNIKTIRFDQEVITDESTLSSQADMKDSASYSHQITPAGSIKIKPNLCLRIKKFFIRRQSSRPMEIGLHPRGMHFIGDAVFHSESGCINCKLDIEKTD